MQNKLNEDFCTVSVKDWKEIQRKLMYLNALERAGVDNWEGYDIVLDLLPDDFWEEEEDD